MQSHLRALLIPACLVLAAAAGSGFWYWAGGGGIPGTEPISIGTPKKEGPIAYLGGSPTLTAGFQDWTLCELCDRIETRPVLLGVTKWGPTALGLQLSPPHNIPAGDCGELPPASTDHAFVMAGSGAVVYIPGEGHRPASLCRVTKILPV